MKKIHTIAIVFTFALSLLPVFTYAQATAADGGVGSSNPKEQDNSAKPDKGSFQLVSCQGIDDPRTKEVEVECDYRQLIATANRLIQFVLWLLSPIVVGMMVWTGFKYMTAGGDANMIADAKRMFTPILLGIFFIMAGWLLVYTVLDKLLADQVSGTGNAAGGTGVQKRDILPANI